MTEVLFRFPGSIREDVVFDGELPALPSLVDEPPSSSLTCVDGSVFAAVDEEGGMDADVEDAPPCFMRMRGVVVEVDAAPAAGPAA